MAIQTRLKQSFLIWNLVYLVITAGLGIWGAYDYWVTIPERERLANEYQELNNDLRELDERAQNNLPLTPEQITRYQEIKEVLAAPPFENTPPQPPAAYDRPLNFWVYFIGCGVLSAPWFLWRLFTKRRNGPMLEDDGSLVTEKGTFPAENISGIDMAKWMLKSTAKVQVADQEDPIVLDDYVYQDTYLLVGALAHRFYPEEWTEEAKPIKPEDEESETEASEEPESNVENTENSDTKNDHD